ncbi:LuxR C-terminal-related transcriptional regulator, partial [Streptomyces sp. NPDC035033]|uniref:helix-turn-helix transcriptional regulator n=1 Tax=Streptomyces sp. NPDC035033 TaxID=3155368 RepID=UPI0033E153A2
MLPPDQPVTTLLMAVDADDALTRHGVETYLRDAGHVTVLPKERRAEAEVCLFLTTEVTDEVLSRMQQAGDEAVEPGMRIVLVADDITERQLIQALSSGLVSFLVRRQVTMPRIRQAVWGARAGRAELPGIYVRALIDQVKAVQRDVLEPRGLALAGFSTREVAVLRLLADGLDTAAVAEKLSYSERTIKNILAAMMARLGLRNRAHAVAYAAPLFLRRPNTSLSFPVGYDRSVSIPTRGAV